jgi:hypothetical protein
MTPSELAKALDRDCGAEARDHLFRGRFIPDQDAKDPKALGLFELVAIRIIVLFDVGLAREGWFDLEASEELLKQEVRALSAKSRGLLEFRFETTRSQSKSGHPTLAEACLRILTETTTTFESEGHRALGNHLRFKPEG